MALGTGSAGGKWWGNTYPFTQGLRTPGTSTKHPAVFICLQVVKYVVELDDDIISDVTTCLRVVHHVVR